MTDSRSVNVFVTSKNRDSKEKPCDFLLNFPSGLIRADDNESIRVNVLSFHIPNNFYNINSLNNSFQIIIRGQSGDTMISFSIFQGNYSTITFRDYINSLCGQYINMIYTNSRNTYSIKSVYSDPTKQILLKPLNSGQFFGLNDNTEFGLTNQYLECPYTVNMCSFDKIVVNCNGLNPEIMSIENIGKNDPEFERSSILLWVSRTDVPINGIIKYDNNDAGNSYSYNIYDSTVNSFRIILSDEYNNVLTSALDYTMLLRFEIYKNDTRHLHKEISQIKEYLKFIYIQMMLLLEYIGLLKK